MPEAAITKWNSLSLVQKVLLIVGLPLVIVLIFTKAGRSILAFLEDRTRTKVDEKSSKMDDQIKRQEADTNRAEGRLEQIEKEKNDAIDKAKNDSPQQAVDFWNSRPGSPDK